jgi:hypothetical protein
MKYRIGIALPDCREMPMPVRRHPKPVQADLFALMAMRPQWNNLPPEIRARVIPLLAQLLRGALADHPAAEAGKEVGRDR